MGLLRVARLLAVGLGILAGTVSEAQAHPHVWIDAQMMPHFSTPGTIQSLRVVWRMDELYSQSAIQGYDSNGDGHYSAAELKPLITVAMDNLKKWFFFTDLRHDGKRIPVNVPTVYEAHMEGDRLVYDFTLPFKAPLDVTKGPLKVRMFDPSYYIEIDLAKKEPVIFDGAHQGCRSVILPARGMKEISLLGMGMGLTEKDYTSIDSQPGTEGFGGPFAKTVAVSCGS